MGAKMFATMIYMLWFNFSFSGVEGNLPVFPADLFLPLPHMETVHLMVSILPALTDTVELFYPFTEAVVFLRSLLSSVQKRVTVSHFNTVCKVLRRGFRLNGYN